MDGEPQKAEGALKIYRLKQPEKVVRPDILGGGRLISRVRPPRGRGKAPVEKRPAQPRLPARPESQHLGTGRSGRRAGADDRRHGPHPGRRSSRRGAYRAKFETQDRFGKKIVALLPLNVLAPEAKTFPIKIPNLVAAPKWSLEPGEEFMALWGSGYDRARAFIEIEHRGKMLQSFLDRGGATQQPVKQAVTEAMRGGFTLRVTMVRENRGVPRVPPRRSALDATRT